MRKHVGIVAIVLASGIVMALLMLCGAALYAVIHHDMEAPRLISVTQVLTAWGSGMIGVLGAYVGYSFGRKDNDDADSR